MKPAALAAVSGGRDSVVLLHWLVEKDDRRLVVCHLNHGLRGRESGQDAAFVRRLARRYGLPCEIGKTDVRALAWQGRMSLETAARQARHDFFQATGERLGIGDVFLAHHAGDQAETVLANACRGAGLAGLAGMKPVQKLAHGITLHRPLLGWRRAQIDEYIARHGLTFREDSSNTSAAHRRNRLRHDILPRLCRAMDRDVTPALARLAAHAARDADFLEAYTQDWLVRHAVLEPDGRLRLTSGLKALHPAILSRVLRHWLQSRQISGLDHDLIESAQAMLRPGGPAKLNLPGGRHLRRKAGRLFVDY